MIFEFNNSPGTSVIDSCFQFQIGDLLLFHTYWDGDIMFSAVVLDVSSKVTMINHDTNEILSVGDGAMLSIVSYVIRN